jgi:hypothetical protein
MAPDKFVALARSMAEITPSRPPPPPSKSAAPPSAATRPPRASERPPQITGANWASVENA